MEWNFSNDAPPGAPDRNLPVDLAASRDASTPRASAGKSNYSVSYAEIEQHKSCKRTLGRGSDNASVRRKRTPHQSVSQQNVIISYSDLTLFLAFPD
jgi:hypothetical protein